MKDRVGVTQSRDRFQALCTALRPDLLRFAFWLSRDRALAEDVVQESMLRAWKAQDALQDETAAKPWFLTIIRREFARTFERKRLVTVDVEELVAQEAVTLASTDDPDLADVRTAMFKLPDDYREPLVLQVLMGYSTAEIARELNLSVPAVLTRLFRARQQLRALVGEDTTQDPAGMIDHAAFRRALLADPDVRSAELDAHRHACAECRQFAQRLAQFEDRLGRALRVEVGEGSGRRPAPVRWYALAASVAAAVLVAGVLWLSAPRTSLAADVVAHMQDEPDAWRTVAPVSAEQAAAVMGKAGVQLMPEAGAVSYASACTFRGRVVPHLVVQSASGPVTVMVLVHESVPHDERFEENGYRGRLLPVPGHGSIAVLEQAARTPELDVDAVAAQVKAALVYTP